MITPARIWYDQHPLSMLLAPLGWCYCALARGRRRLYREGWRASHRLPVPVLVVGNLTVGGTGKTPLVIWLCGWLRERGYRPGVLIRGYGGRGRTWPVAVAPGANPTAVGDEAALLAERCGCPVMAGPDRVASGQGLIEGFGCDILVADDGLQHYRLQRDIEIALIDGQRRLGNGRCLPAGPLREPGERLAEVDLVIVNGAAPGDRYGMSLVPGPVVSLEDPERTCGLGVFSGRTVLAVAGIGNPERFFQMLGGQGIRVIPRPYPDHHPFTADEVQGWLGRTVLMTEKDGVKCRYLSGSDRWVVRVRAEPDTRTRDRFEQLLDGLDHG